jgi:hypothetical protein
VTRHKTSLVGVLSDMLNLIRAGGVPVLFVLAFGLAGLLTALFHVRNPQPRHAEFLGWMMQATLYSTLCGLAADVGATMHYLVHMPASEDFARTLAQGLGESMSPGILGFAMLSLIAFLRAIAARRSAALG